MPAHRKPMNREILYKMYEYQPSDGYYSTNEIAEALGVYRGTARKWLLELKKQGIVDETGTTNNPLKPMSRAECPDAMSNKNEWFLTDAGTKLIENELYRKLNEIEKEYEEDAFFFMRDLYYKKEPNCIPERSIPIMEHLNLVQKINDNTYELLVGGEEYVESILEDDEEPEISEDALKIMYFMHDRCSMTPATIARGVDLPQKTVEAELCGLEEADFVLAVDDGEWMLTDDGEEYIEELNEKEESPYLELLTNCYEFVLVSLGDSVDFDVYDSFISCVVDNAIDTAYVIKALSDNGYVEKIGDDKWRVTKKGLENSIKWLEYIKTNEKEYDYSGYENEEEYQEDYTALKAKLEKKIRSN